MDGSPLLERAAAADVELPTIDLADIASAFETAIKRSGLVLPEERATACLAALIAKPFAIFTGLSGSGKTQLALKLGDWLGAAGTVRRHTVVAVRPDWTGPEALFGYEDALQPRSSDGRAAWHVPKPLEFMLDAVRDPDRPYLMILDEMNLAHVERYFSDYLSAAESREPILPNLEAELSAGQRSWRIRPGAPAYLPIPRNLWVIGTVNIDETTYMFSPKVLDRAFVFEFRVTTEELAAEPQRPSDLSAADAAMLQSLIAIGRDDQWQESRPHSDREQLVRELQGVHALLAASGHEFGFRVMAESLRFAAIYYGTGRDDKNEVLDLIAMQKLLPRLHGSRRQLEPVLRSYGVGWLGRGHGGSGRSRDVSAVTTNRRKAAADVRVASSEPVRQLHGVELDVAVMTNLTLRTDKGACVGTMSIAALPTSGAAVPRDRSDDPMRSRHEPPIQLREASSYRYKLEIPGVAAVRLEPSELFDPDDSSGLTGRLKTQQNVGDVAITVLGADGAELGSAPVLVRAAKLEHEHEYQRMLRDIADVAAEAVLQGFAPATTSTAILPSRAPRLLYQQFAILQARLTDEELQDAIARVVHRPQREWIDETEWRPAGRPLKASAAVARALTEPGRRVRAAKSIGPLDTLPKVVPSRRTEETVDTVPNRFVKFALMHWRELVVRQRFSG